MKEIEEQPKPQEDKTWKIDTLVNSTAERNWFRIIKAVRKRNYMAKMNVESEEEESE